MSEFKEMTGRQKWDMQSALTLKQALAADGFKTSWERPMLNWLHGREVVDGIPSRNFYVSDLPIERITPFDFSEIHINIGAQVFFFELTFYYTKALEHLEYADEINEVYDRYVVTWAPKMADHFLYLTMEFPLKWDTDFEEFIEHSGGISLVTALESYWTS